MARIFFHQRHGDTLVKDPEGTDYDDLAVAKREAEAALHEMLAEDIDAERPLEPMSIELTNENGEVIATIDIKGSVEMVQKTEN
jgi:hypothetical protein